MSDATTSRRWTIFAGVVVVALAIAVTTFSLIRVRRHPAMPAIDPHARSYFTDGVHDVSRPLREIDQRAASVDPCAESDNQTGWLRHHLREAIGEWFGGACGEEEEREREEALSAGNTIALDALLLAAVPDNGSVEQTSSGPRAALATEASFNSGLNSALDNNIAVGPNNLVAMINSRFQVMSKTGTVTFGPVQNNSIFSGFANGVCANSGDGHIQYDQLAGRWLFTLPNFSSGYWICYAVSTTDDPTGPYYRYAFPRPLFPDYPRVAVWPDGYYTTTSTGDTVIQKTACVVDRAKMLLGQTATQQCFTVNNVSFMEPANVDGQTPPPSGAPELVFAAGGSQLNSILQDDGIYVYKLHVDWTTPANSTFTGPSKIQVSPYSFLCGGQLVNCVPQPGSTTRLDAQGDKIMHRAAYRNRDGVESIVLQHSINTAAGGGGPRWYELRVDGAGDPQLYQQSTYAPDNRYRWMGSVGMDRKGNIAIGFSYGGGPYTLPMTTSSCVQPACDRVGVRFTARQAGDPLGVMTYADGIIASSASSATGGSNRWEDWSVLAIDPTDDCTFWYNGGYMPAGATSYNGRIGAWRLPNCRLDAFAVAASPVPTQQFTGAVATFTDSDLTATIATFTANIDWGDGTSSAGTVSGGAGSFMVSGSHTYAGSGSRTITTTITGSEGSTASASSTVVVSNVGSPPSVTLLSPLPLTTWSVGEAVTFSATASDAEDGPLGGGAMTWSLILHRCPSTCDTQVIDTRIGVSGGTFTAVPDTTYPSTLEVRLTVTDSSGLQTTAGLTLQPRTVSLSFASVPSGLQLTVGTVTSTSPFARTVIPGSTNGVNAPSPQSAYQFTKWSDDGAQSHPIVAPAAPASYTATFSGPPPGSTVISVDFVGSGTSMASTEIAGPMAKTHWNNATGASRATALPLVDETGAATTATVTWSSNNTWSTAITDTAGNRRMMKGYLDTTSSSTTSVVVSGIAGPFDVYVMADGSNGNGTRTATYQISGTGFTTKSVTLTDTANTDFNATFTEANSSAGNYVKFSIVAVNGFTISAIPGTSTDSNRRAPLNGLQIVPTGPPPVDTTPPSVAITSPAGGTVSGTLTLAATASDNVGVASVQFQRDGVDIGGADTTAPYSVAWDTTTVANGAHSLTAIARDAAGNQTTATAIAVSVTNDLTPPTVSISAPAGGATVGGTVQIAADATDDIGVTSVQFVVNGANLGAADTIVPYNASWSTSGLANGSYTLTAIARDAAGRQTTSAPVVVTVFNAPPADTTPPTVAITSPAGGTVSGTLTLAATASDNVGVTSVQFQRDGVDIGSADTTAPYQATWDTTTVANGAHSLTAIARDAAGNQTTSTAIAVSVTNDLTPPTVGISTPAAGATVGGTVPIAADATDDIGVTSVQFVVNGANLGAADITASYNASWSTSGLANGSYTLTAIARDAAGRQTTSAPVVVTVFNAPPPPDTTPPTVSLTAPAAGTVSGTVNVTATAADNVAIANVQFRLNGAALGSADTTSPYSVAWDTKTSANGGPYLLTAVATDTNGNTTTSAAVSVTISNIASTGLVAAYGFNENSGASAADASGNGRTGTIANATWTTAGKFGSALTFNGTNALVTIADHASLDLSTGMTLEAWVYPTTLGSSWRSVILKEGAGVLAYALYANENVSRASGYVRLNGVDQAATGTTGLPLNAWTHLAATFDGSTIRLYVNGAAAGTRTAAGSIAATTGVLRIGGNQIWSEYFAGRIDEVRIYNRALSVSEVQNDMNAPVGP